MTHPRSFALREGLPVWSYVAVHSFGGPAGQIAVMHRVLVDEKKWVTEAQFLHALNFCMLLPGPEAQQLAIYLGWLLHGTLGGVVAGCLFVLPGLLSILALSVLYVNFHHLPIFYGLRAVVIAILLQAFVRIARRVLKDRKQAAIAAAAFVAIYFFKVPFPILLAAMLAGVAAGAMLR